MPTEETIQNKIFKQMKILADKLKARGILPDDFALDEEEVFSKNIAIFEQQQDSVSYCCSFSLNKLEEIEG